MPNEFILNCLILGRTNPLPITIGVTANVLSLKEAIIARGRLQIPATSLGIYKAAFDFEVANEIIDREARNACKSEELKDASLLKRLFHDALQPEQVHVVAVPRGIWFARSWNATIPELDFIPIGFDSRIIDLKQELLRFLGLQVPADKVCTLSGVSLPIDDNIQERLRQFSSSEKNSAILKHGSQMLSDVFPDMNEDRLRIIIEIRDLDLRIPERKLKCRGTLEALLAEYKDAIGGILKAEPPSQAAKSTSMPKSQYLYSIYDGRCGTDDQRARIAPPVELSHPAFAHFLDGIETDFVPDVDFLRKTIEYMIATTKVYANEHLRTIALRSTLSALIGFPINTIIYDDKCKPDGLAQAGSRKPAIILIQEDKLELGDGASDPSAQARFSMARGWCQTQYKQMRDATCCPTFLLATAGPWISVLGGVFPDVFIIQHLTDFVLAGIDRFLTERRVYKVARIFYHLRQGLDTLNAYYMGVTPADEPDCARFFPPITSFVQKGSEKLVTFSYLGYLEDEPACVTLIARRHGYPKDDRIVVKFVERYGDSAHRTLVDDCERPFAPQLYYCERNYGHRNVKDKKADFCMVVMEHIAGETLFKAKKRLTNDEMIKIEEQIQGAVQILHDKGLVHGDLREPNIIVTPSGEAKLIDFDWAGTAGQVTYPPLLSPDIAWAKGAQPMGAITMSHDKEMLEKIFLRFHPVD